jgi:hypothetical protein
MREGEGEGYQQELDDCLRFRAATVHPSWLHFPRGVSRQRLEVTYVK